MSFNIAAVNEAIAEAVPDREALVFRDRRYTFKQLNERANRLANYLLSRNVTIQRPRANLANWESGQDHVALYMYNGNEYLESMLAVMKARAAPFNVNFRYVSEELLYLFRNAATQAIIFHARFSPLIADILAQLPPMKAVIQVADGSGAALLPGAIDYEAAIAMSSPERPPVALSADDIYMLYTGGTTGKPKGVLWRHGELLDHVLGGKTAEGRMTSLEDYRSRARKSPGHRYIPTPPFMHGTGQWIALGAWHRGNTVVIQDEVEHFDAEGLVRKIEAERISTISIVGDAFGRPILDVIRSKRYDVSSLRHVFNSGAALSAQVKAAFVEEAPRVRVHDAIGSSETGPQGLNTSSAHEGASTGRFRMSEASAVLSEDLAHVLAPGHEAIGRFASKGNVPLGYLGDEEKTRQTFPVIDGVRYSAPGDRVRLLANGEIEFLGRDSFTINSGGEKIFAEEVEQALRAHSDVVDVVVSSRPSERWGSEVVAIVQLAENVWPDEKALLRACAHHIAPFKNPKAFVFVDKVRRGPNGKADYAWAKALAEGTLNATA